MCVEIEPLTLTTPVNTRLTAELKDPLPIEINYTFLNRTSGHTGVVCIFTLPVFLTGRFAEHQVVMEQVGLHGCGVGLPGWL